METPDCNADVDVGVCVDGDGDVRRGRERHRRATWPSRTVANALGPGITAGSCAPSEHSTPSEPPSAFLPTSVCRGPYLSGTTCPGTSDLYSRFERMRCGVRGRPGTGRATVLQPLLQRPVRLTRLLPVGDPYPRRS